MADWLADGSNVYENHDITIYENGHSRQSSSSSGRSGDWSDRRVTGSRADDNFDRTSQGSGASASSSDRGVLLAGGNQLTEESITENRNGINTNGSVSGEPPRIPPKDPILSGKMKKPAPSVPIITGPVDTIHEDDITIPNDGCLFNFTADQMATFFRYMRIEDRFIGHMHRKGLDGKRFSRMKDSEMESCGINNPVIKFFRDKSVKKTKGRKMPFLL